MKNPLFPPPSDDYGPEPLRPWDHRPKESSAPPLRGPSAAGGPPLACPAHGDRWEDEPVRLSTLDSDRPPAELYRELRSRFGPVAPVLLDDDIPAWLALGYPEVAYVTSHDEEFGRDSRRWHQWENIPGDWPLLAYAGYQPSVFFAEGEEHRRRAGALTRALEAMDMYDVSLVCESVGRRLTDRFVHDGHAELLEAYVHALPVRVMIELCGMPAGEEITENLAEDLRITLDAERGENPVEAYRRVARQLGALIASRRERPERDLTSYLVADPAALTDTEAVHDLTVLILAGQQPTANWICNALRLLLLDERFADKVAGGRVGVPEALTETLWLDTPVQNFLGRWATRDTELGGRPVKQGDCVLLGLAAANTDPELWPHGGMGEGSTAHLSFSMGEHRCPHPSPQMARVIARTAIDTLLARLPDLAVAVEADELRWRRSLWKRGLEELPVVFSAGGVREWTDRGAGRARSRETGLLRD